MLGLSCENVGDLFNAYILMSVTLRFLTIVGYIVVLEIVLGQFCVLSHAELNCLEHFRVVVELIVC